MNELHLSLVRQSVLEEWKPEIAIRSKNELTAHGYVKDYDAIVTVRVDGRTASFALEYERTPKKPTDYLRIRRLLEQEDRLPLPLQQRQQWIVLVQQQLVVEVGVDPGIDDPFDVRKVHDHAEPVESLTDGLDERRSDAVEDAFHGGAMLRGLRPSGPRAAPPLRSPLFQGGRYASELVGPPTAKLARCQALFM